MLAVMPTADSNKCEKPVFEFMEDATAEGGRVVMRRIRRSVGATTIIAADGNNVDGFEDFDELAEQQLDSNEKLLAKIELTADCDDACGFLIG